MKETILFVQSVFFFRKKASESGLGAQQQQCKYLTNVRVYSIVE